MNRAPLPARFARCLLLLLLLGLPQLVTGCGPGGLDAPLLTDVTPDAGKLDLSGGANQSTALNLVYQVGQPARVSVRLQGPRGQSYLLRENEERTPGAYSLRLNGAVEVLEDGLAQTRLLADGQYRYIIRAVAAGGETREAAGRLEVLNSPNDPEGGPPGIEGLWANPALISPNFDAREDTALLGWRTTRPATVTVSVAGANGFSKVLKTLKNQPAQEDKTVFNGLDQRSQPLADGVYTYTVQAADRWGNITRRAGKVEIKGGGVPSAVIEQVSIGPTEIIRGNLVTVTMRVRNTGKVPIRSQGPDSGYIYNTREVFSSIEGGNYVDKAGFWRVGVDYESNSGGGASRYPFRWGFGKELQPGEVVEVVGVIRVDRPEEKLKFYAGLIQEQIALPQDRLQITQIKISY